MIFKRFNISQVTEKINRMVLVFLKKYWCSLRFNMVRNASERMSIEIKTKNIGQLSFLKVPSGNKYLGSLPNFLRK
tara:strand:- start:203 stop:430 length:228 start_codon:yes stop_codon:yes gene_type:complete